MEETESWDGCKQRPVAISRSWSRLHLPLLVPARPASARPLLSSSCLPLPGSSRGWPRSFSWRRPRGQQPRQPADAPGQHVLHVSTASCVPAPASTGEPVSFSSSLALSTVNITSLASNFTAIVSLINAYHIYS